MPFLDDNVQLEDGPATNVNGMVDSHVPDSRLPVVPTGSAVDPAIIAQIDAEPSFSPEQKAQIKAAYIADPASWGKGGRVNDDGRLEIDIGGGAAPAGGSFLPDDVQLSDAAQPGFGEQALQATGRGVRDVMNTAGAAGDLISLPVTALLRLLGADPGSLKDLTNQGADALGLPDSTTPGQKLISVMNEGAGMGALTAGAGGLLSAAPGVAGAVGETLAAAPVSQSVASATGAGAGEMARQHGAGPVGELAATLAGGGIGALGVGGVAKAAEALGPRTASDLSAAFDRLDVPAMPADLGGHFTRLLTAGSSKLTLGGIPIEQAAQKSVAAAQAARSAIADRIGNVARETSGKADITGAGQVGQQGMRNWMATTEGRASKLYDAVPIAAKAETTLSHSREAFADVNRGMESNKELSALIADKRLQKWEAAIKGASSDVPTGLLDADGNPITRSVQKGGKLSWEDLKAFRSYVGELAGKPSLQNDTSQAALKRIYAGLSEDMRATAKANGASKQFERANSYYRARQNRIENVVTGVLGKDGNLNGEAAFRQIERWSAVGGNAAAAAKALRSMSPDEAATVRATIFEKLGSVPKGRNDASENLFSPFDFVTHWNGLSGRAKAALFPGADYRQSIDDMVRVAAAQKAAAKLGQGSPTAHLLQSGQVAGRAGALVMNVFTNPLAAMGVIADIGGELAAGKLLASPRFARWLSSAPAKPNPAARLAHINRLTAIAAAEPTIANEVLHLQERLASAFANGPQRIAAEPEGDQQ